MGEQINIGSLVADLDIKTTNLEANMANAGSALYEVKVKIADLQRAFAAGVVGAAEFADRMQFLAMSQNQLEDAISNATSATVASTSAYATGAKGASAFGSSMNTTNAQSRQAAVAMMQLGYAVDDIQYGFRGVVNNIAPFVYSLTAASGASRELSAGIATFAQIGVVAAYQLYTHWDQVMDLFGMGKVRTEAEEMEELGKKTGKTADETERLNKYKKEQAEIAQLLSKQSKEQKDREQDIGNAFAEYGDKDATGGEKVVAGIARVNQARGGGADMTEEDKKRIQDLRGGAPAERTWANLGGLIDFNPDVRANVEKAEEEIRKRLNNEDIEKAKKQALEATKDPKALLAKVKENPGAFPAGLAKDLEDNLPENRKQQEQFEAKGRANAKQMAERFKEEAKQDKEDRDAQEKQVKDSTKDILSGPGMVHALKGGLTTENVEQALKDSGMQPEQARKLAPDVEMRAKEETQSRVRDYALKNGMSEDQARGNLIDDQREKFSDDATKRAKKLAPGLDEFAQNRVAGAMMSGDPRSMDAVRAEIAETIRRLDMKDGKQDLTDEHIDAASNAVVEDAQQDIQKKIAGEKPEQQKQEKSKAEQFDAAALASKVQGGVGTPLDEQKKSNTYLEQAVKYLAKMSGNGGAGGDPFSIG